MALNWYVGPWIWDSRPGLTRWRPPNGLVGLDMRKLADMGSSPGTNGLGIFFGEIGQSNLENKRDYTLLGTGSWYDIKPSTAIRNKIPCRKNYVPKGDDLVGIIYDILTDGADPDGLDGPKPIIPTIEGRVELNFGQRHSEKFNFNTTHGNIVKTVLQKEFSNLWGRDENLARKVLGYWENQYTNSNLASWSDLVPSVLKSHVKGPLSPETTLTETFNKADSTTLGPNMTWTEYADASVADKWSVVSNVCRYTPFHDTQHSVARAESDLSSSDHSAQVVVINLTAGGAGTDNGQIGVCARFSSSAATCYLARAVYTLGTVHLNKNIAGTITEFSSIATTLTLNKIILCKVNGSTIEAYYDGVLRISTTDTTITSGTRAGIFGYHSTPTTGQSELDNFQATDLTSSSILYTQLERGTRGLLRGVYTGRI